MLTSPPSEAELVLVVAASFFLVEPADMDVPDMVWMTLPDLYSCMVDGGQSGLKRMLASRVFSRAILSFPATGSKFLEYKTFLVSQGITKIERMSWDKLIGSLRKRSNGNPHLKHRKGRRMEEVAVSTNMTNEVPVAEMSLKELIKLYWVDTGGNTTKLFEKITGIGRQTTVVSVTSAKSNLLNQDKWVPPGGLVVANRTPRSPRQTNKTAEPPKAVPLSNSELIRQGVKMVSDGLAMIEQGLGGMEAFQAKIKELAPLLDALKV